jgi:hypothetical protein
MSRVLAYLALGVLGLTQFVVTSRADDPRTTIFSGRSGVTKSRLIEEFGGNMDSERAVLLGLAWLKRQQKEDGGWEFDQGDKEDRIAATAMVLLSFLGAGETHKERDTDYRKYRETVEKGLKFLLKHCPAEGANAGRMSINMQSQSLATIALCEAYGLTRDKELKPHAQAAINYIQKNQAKGGGWSATADGTSNITVTGWAIQAIHVGWHTRDLITDARVIKNAVVYLDSLATGMRKSMYGTTDKSDADPGTTPTAIGLRSRYCIDAWGPSHPSMIDGVAGLMKNPPARMNRDPLYVYHATQVVFGYYSDDWKTWNAGPKDDKGVRKGGTQDLLVNSQARKIGADMGSWDPEGEFGKRYGRLGTTAIYLLTLEVYYRYLPLYKRGADGNAIKILEDK